MDCREYTCLIIKKDNEFLVGCIMGTNILRWSNSPYDAWITRKRQHAIKVANYVNGNIMLFNPIVGQLRECKGGTFSGY